jgi:hypothetical protein
LFVFYDFVFSVFLTIPPKTPPIDTPYKVLLTGLGAAAHAPYEHPAKYQANPASSYLYSPIFISSILQISKIKQVLFVTFVG